MVTLLTYLIGSAAIAASPGVPLEKILDNTFLPPGVEGTIILGARPVPCLGNVFYTILDEELRLGLYAVTPRGLAVIADHRTPVPGTTNTFQNAHRPTCAGDRLAFLGAGDRSSLTGQVGIYEFSQGIISTVFETDMPLGGSHIQSFASLDANELGIVADITLFPAGDKQAIAMQPFDGDTFIVADRSTVLPGQTEPVSILARPILVGSDIVFHGRTRFNVGIYRWREGEGISLVADNRTPVPLAGQGNFFAFGIFANLSGRIVFGATYAGGLGIFASEDGQLEPVVLPGELTAEGATLTLVEEPRGAGDLLTFRGRTPEDSHAPAVFVKEGDGPVRRIWGVGDVIEGRMVHNVASNADHRDVLVWAEALDLPGRQYIYRARFAAAPNIPTLAWYGAVLLGLALAVSGWRVLRRLSGRSGG